MKTSTSTLCAIAGLLSLASAFPARNSSCGLPLVSDKGMQAAITKENLLKCSQSLQDFAYSTAGRNRVTGSEGHNLTLAYIVSELRSLGDYYNVEVVPWSDFVQTFGETSLTVNGAAVNSTVMEFSGNATLVDTPVVAVANIGCSAADYPAAVAGQIALISRGTCPFAEKAALARQAGAAAVIIYDNAAGDVLSGTYGGKNDTLAPGVGLTQAAGQAILASLSGNSTVRASLTIRTVIEQGFSANIIAMSKYGDADNVLFLGAHSDSVAAGPGINDDGSGVCGILETAKQLARYRTKAQVKFGWWTAEEAGTLGSGAYVASLSDAELLKIRLYLNFDMIASPNYILGAYDGDGSTFGETGPAGSAEAEHLFEAYYESLGLNHTATEFNGRSDYGDFLAAGVPCGGLDAGADEVKTQEWADMFGGTAGIILDPNYHTAQDTVSNLNSFCYETMSKGIGHAVAVYAGSGFADFPARAPPAVKRRQAAAAAKPKSKPSFMGPVVNM